MPFSIIFHIKNDLNDREKKKHFIKCLFLNFIYKCDSSIVLNGLKRKKNVKAKRKPPKSERKKSQRNEIE